MGKSMTHAMKNDPVFDPADMTAAKLDDYLEYMDDAATQGFFWRGRTGHEIVPIDIHIAINKPDKPGRKLAHCNTIADRQFICALVNAWRTGRLTVVPLNQEGLS